ncbi:DUF2975 domain-containing protein [Novosphingobium sp. M1R2S20]|uniref:DUF2975 domain-containing protein n=1 Tax=Novosphingobium rhizovicinum TaxID=3228928 RepID=A0ABV3RBE4_9SPHN
MTSITRDPLLAAAKGILWFLMGVMLVGAVACVVAMPAMLLLQDNITIQLGKDAPTVPVPTLLWALAGLLVFVIALLLVLFRIFQLLKRIVSTVGEGDPFVPENATRLTQMAWLTLAVQLVTLPISGFADWIDEAFADAPEVHSDITINAGLSGNGLLLMLILFILARVFRKGAAMRAELEGTV